MTVHAADAATEVFLVDHDLRKIAQATGKLEVDVAPGLYKLRYRAGDAVVDDLVEIEPGIARKDIVGKSVAFTSSVPLSSTGDTHEYQRYPASTLSREVHRRVGQGSQLFVFVRDPSEERKDRQARPADTVQIRRADGDLLHDLMTGAQRNESQFWGGANLEVDPGTYRLRVDTGKLGTYESFIVASPGWQTQVFLAVDDVREGTKTERRPRLSTASVLMARVGGGFDPDDERERLGELARQALGSGRNVVTHEALREMLDEKDGNPMSGILAAHVLRSQADPDRGLIQSICSRLRSLIGDHPDVTALELDTQRGNASFALPPMLRTSWHRIVAATQTRPELVPRGSLADRIADGVVASGPWLLWRVSESPSLAVQRAARKEAPLDWVNQFVTSMQSASQEQFERWLREGGRYRRISGLGQGVLYGLRSAAGGVEGTPIERIEPADLLRRLSADLKVPLSSIERTTAELASVVKMFKA